MVLAVNDLRSRVLMQRFDVLFRRREARTRSDGLASARTARMYVVRTSGEFVVRGRTCEAMVAGRVGDVIEVMRARLALDYQRSVEAESKLGR